MAAPAPTVDTSRIDRRFDVLRQKVDQQAGEAAQAAQEGLARKAVAQGAEGSGAFMKAGAQQEKAIAAQKQSAVNDIEGQKEAAIGQAEEIQAQRDFTKGEREAGQDFAAQQANINRLFTSGEAEKGRSFEQGMARENQAFTSKEAAIQRGFSGDLFQKDLDFKKDVQKTSEGQFAQQFDQALKQFDFDKLVSQFNMDMANKQFNKHDILEGGQFADQLSQGGWGKPGSKPIF